jgi:MoxR-like ATPase
METVALTTASVSRQRLCDLATEVEREIVGQRHLIERLLIALLADGHVLLEGVPGLAKTKTLAALAAALSADMKRVQFTPDLLPSDLIGTEVFRPQSGEFVIRRGPVFTNILLADEINRAPAKVQSALLQAMQERQVTIGEHTFPLPTPFIVLATQNPIEQEGTYPLPEAQLDRFLMKVKVTYPAFKEEVDIVARATAAERQPIVLNKVMTLDDVAAARRDSQMVHVDATIDQYVVALVHASRRPEEHGLKGSVDWGASPRASIALKVCARCLAYLQGRSFVTPDDVKAVAPDVLRHRIVTSFEADARGVTSEEVIRVLLKSVAVP